MTVNKVPFVVASPAAEVTAALFRQAISSFLNPTGGTVAEKGLTVSAKATPNMEVEVEGGDPNGQIWIPGTSLSNQGLYFCSVDSTTSVAIGAASTANPRIDTVIAQVEDSFYAGSKNEFLPPQVIPGTPKAGLTKPPKTRAEAEADGAGALPASSYVLAYILVPQNASTITSGDIENVSRQVKFGPSGAENKYVAVIREAGVSYKESPTRPTEIILTVNSTGQAKIVVGGVEIHFGGQEAAVSRFSITFRVNPGEEWKWTAAEEHGYECFARTL
jgi:hypothetical protein